MPSSTGKLVGHIVSLCPRYRHAWSDFNEEDGYPLVGNGQTSAVKTTQAAASTGTQSSDTHAVADTPSLTENDKENSNQKRSAGEEDGTRKEFVLKARRSTLR